MVRDYGLPNPVPKGIPVATKAEIDGGCPNCGCESLHMIDMEVETPEMMKEGKTFVKYVGCPACPWASPSMFYNVDPNPNAIN